MAFVKLLETYNREISANRGSSTHTELELRFTIRSLDEYKRLLLGVLADTDISSVAHSVAIIKRDKIASSWVQHSKDASKSPGRPMMTVSEPDKIATREYTDQDGKMIKSEVLTYSTKKRITIENVKNEFVEYRLAISAEAPSSEFDYKLFTVLRLKLRLSAVVANMPDWRFDFTLVDELTSLTPDFAKRRDALFQPGLSAENFISNAPFEAAKHYEFEVEYTGGATLTVPDVYHVIDYVRSTGGFGNSQGARYQEVIYEIAKLMYPPGKAANFRAKSGRKALGPSVIGLTREVYFREILPKIVGMRVTIKLNGEGMIGKIVGSTVEAVSGTLVEAKSATPVASPIVYDSEYIDGKQHVFDVYVYDKQNLLESADLGVRDSYIAKVSEILGPDIAIAKVHTVLTENYAQELTNLWEKRAPGSLPADGLIFDNRLKWKPEAEMTVDFLTMHTDTQSVSTPSRAGEISAKKYILFGGMNKTQSREYNIRPLPGYNKIFRGRTFHDYFPIQFAPGDKADAYMFDGSDVKEDLHNRICEYSYDPKTGLWKFHRIRTDRDAEVARGSYFGNNIAVAIATWNSIHDPLTFDMLRSSVSDAPESSTGYFGTTDQKYAPANKFSSYMKEQSIAPFKRLSWVIDLACGRGADIGRWARLGIKTALCVDNDILALKELMTRHLGNQRKMHHYKLGVAVLKANLNDPYEAQVDAFRAGAPGMPPGVPLIVCNMAIHYMCQSDASIWNFVMLIDRLLEVGGHFIFTSYNGARIFDLLGDKEQVDFMEGTNVKYSIKRDYKPGPFKNFGQGIKPLLGCAGGMYVSEYLVNIAYLVRMFARRGFKLVSQVRFDSVLSTYSIDNIENYDKLDDADHEHIGLYDYVVLQKEKAIASEPIEMKPEEIVNIVSLPGKDAGVPVRNNEISAAALIIPGPAIEQLPTKDIRASINVKNAPDISAGRVSVIILPNRKFPGLPKIKKDGTVAKKIPQHEIIPGDRLEINSEFEVVVEEVAIVSTYAHLPDKFSIASLSTSAKTREEWVLQFQEQNAALVGFELMGLRVRKL